jgi:hypothetical protein
LLSTRKEEEGGVRGSIDSLSLLVIASALFSPPVMGTAWFHLEPQKVRANRRVNGFRKRRVGFFRQKSPEIPTRAPRAGSTLRTVLAETAIDTTSLIALIILDDARPTDGEGRIATQIVKATTRDVLSRLR